MELRQVIVKVTKTAEDLPVLLSELQSLSDEVKEAWQRLSISRGRALAVEHVQNLETLARHLMTMKSTNQVTSAYAKRFESTEKEFIFFGEFFTLKIEKDGPRYLCSLSGKKFTEKTNQFYHWLVSDHGWTKTEGYRVLST